MKEEDKCDEVDDCGDNSDEKNCSTSMASLDSYLYTFSYLQ